MFIAKSFLAGDFLSLRISCRAVCVFTASGHLPSPLAGIRAYLLAGMKRVQVTSQS
jgi:hypothetical protein